MARDAATLTRVREEEYTQSIGTITIGAVLVVVCLFLIWFVRLFHLTPETLQVVQIGFGLGTLAGLTIIVSAIYRMLTVGKIPTVPYTCPYCDGVNRLTSVPTQDFDCETCLRTVRFENGAMAPIIEITCPRCDAKHRTSLKTQRYVCDKCNASIPVEQAINPATQSGLSGAVAGHAVVEPYAAYGQPAVAQPILTPRAGNLLVAQNVDILLQGIDHVREKQIALRLQDMMGMDMAELRHLISTAEEKKPLIIGVNIAHDEAETLQHQLKQLGAIVTLRPH